MKVNRELQQKIENACPDRFREQYDICEQEGTLIGEYAYLKFEYGSKCQKRTQDEMLTNPHMHKWTLFIRLKETKDLNQKDTNYNADIHKIIRQV